MRQLRQIISAVTFPGVVFHELGHKIFCELSGTKVVKACYFRLGNPAGYVIHERPKSFTSSFFIATGPFITGSIFALLFFTLATHYVHHQAWQAALYWLGFSVAINCFPSNTDGKGLLRDSNRHIRQNLLALLGYPFVLLIMIANALSIVFFDVIYAILLWYLANQWMVMI